MYTTSFAVDWVITMPIKSTPVEYRTIGFYHSPCDNCGSPNTIVYKHGHRVTDHENNTANSYAGIWECVDCGASESCEHRDERTEEFTHDALDSRGEHTQYTTRGNVCGWCETVVDAL